MPSALGKLWRGQYPLWAMFWGFYVLGYLVSFGLLVLIAPQIHAQPWRLLSVLVLTVPYNVLSTAGVLRSAGDYRGSRWWSVPAIIFVCFWELRLILSLYAGVSKGLTEWT